MEHSRELIEAFISATTFTVLEMARVEVFVRDSSPAPASEAGAGTCAMIRLLSPRGDSLLSLVMPEPTAAALTQRLLPDTPADPELIRDCVGEFANVIAGQAKTLLVGTPSHFDLTTPTFQTGVPAAYNSGRWRIQFDSEAGSFAVYLDSPM